MDRLVEMEEEEKVRGGCGDGRNGVNLPKCFMERMRDTRVLNPSSLYYPLLFFGLDIVQDTSNVNVHNSFFAQKKNNVSMALFVHAQVHIYNLLRQLYECSTDHYRLSEIVPDMIDVCNPFQILVTLVVDISGVHVYGTCPGCRLADSNSIHTARNIVISVRLIYTEMRTEHCEECQKLQVFIITTSDSINFLIHVRTKYLTIKYKLFISRIADTDHMV